MVQGGEVSRDGLVGDEGDCGLESLCCAESGLRESKGLSIFYTGRTPFIWHWETQFYYQHLPRFAVGSRDSVENVSVHLHCTSWGV